MNGCTTEIVNDGDEISKSFIARWEIEDYCDQHNGKNNIAFVGAIIKRDRILFSYPKQYNPRIENQHKCIKQILKIIASNKIHKGSYDKGEKGEFPVKAYIEVAYYYKKYGIYSFRENYNKKGYEGNIDWNKTINKSQKIITEKGLIFFPFVLARDKRTLAFVSECMHYVLDDANQYKDVISFILPYRHKLKNSIFNDLNYVLKQLKKLRSQCFKDKEKRLIQGLISYIQWKTETKDNVRLLTLSFENYWEDMMNRYLNMKFSGYKNDKIVWSNNMSNSFAKPQQEFVESDKVVKSSQSNHYKIGYDLFMSTEDGSCIYLFDSKYYTREINKLDYKQLFYHYHAKSQFENSVIINGLLIPTSQAYYTKIHVDRSDIDEVKIVEHYINLSDVLDCYEHGMEDSYKVD